MFALFTDFGFGGFYVGQMHAVLATEAPGRPIVDLMHDAPAFSPEPAGYLLAALLPFLPEGTIVVAVVDPGVGTERMPVAVRADGRWLVGPDNGMFEPALRRASLSEAWRLDWRPRQLSASFHGRDLFAPAAARIAVSGAVPGAPIGSDRVRRPDRPHDLAEIVHIDGYGNAMTGLRASTLGNGDAVAAGGQPLPRARTFGERPAGSAFWYENSIGLAEIAVNRGSAAELFGLSVGSPVTVSSG
jgi:hypothetical protein